MTSLRFNVSQFVSVQRDRFTRLQIIDSVSRVSASLLSQTLATSAFSAIQFGFQFPVRFASSLKMYKIGRAPPCVFYANHESN